VRVFISGSDAAEVAAGVEPDGEVAAADEDCAGLDDGEDACGEVGEADDCDVEDQAAEDCDVEDQAAEDCVVDAGAAGAAACVPEVCAEHGITPHTEIAQPSSTITTRAAIPTGKRPAARIFIRLSTAPPQCGTRVFRLHVSPRTRSLLAGWNCVN
jgi:hypothetical protein